MSEAIRRMFANAEIGNRLGMKLANPNLDMTVEQALDAIYSINPRVNDLYLKKPLPMFYPYSTNHPKEAQKLLSIVGQHGDYRHPQSMGVEGINDTWDAIVRGVRTHSTRNMGIGDKARAKALGINTPMFIGSGREGRGNLVLAMTPPVPSKNPWVEGGVTSRIAAGSTLPERERFNIVDIDDPTNFEKWTKFENWSPEFARAYFYKAMPGEIQIGMPFKVVNEIGVSPYQPKVQVVQSQPIILPSGTRIASNPAVEGKLKIISGGQTGADYGALIAARELGIPTGGMAPMGWRVDGGVNPELEKFGLIQSDSSDYTKRTMRNVDDADATLALLWQDSPGTLRTIGYARTGQWGRVARDTSIDGRKPVLVVKTQDLDEATNQVMEFMKQVNPSTINVAGHRERVAPGIQDFTSQLIKRVFGGDAKPRFASTQANPLVDYSTMKPWDVPNNVYSRSNEPFLQALTNPTLRATKLKRQYPVEYAGYRFSDADAAFFGLKDLVLPERRVELLSDINAAKFMQHPFLRNEVIKRSGGDIDKYFNTLNHYTGKANNEWHGQGMNSPAIQALYQGFQKERPQIERELRFRARKEEYNPMSARDLAYYSQSLKMPISDLVTPL